MKKIEKETILITSEGDSAYEIFTYNSSLKRRLAAFATRYPELCKKIRFSTDGSETYSVDKSRVSIRLLPPYSE
ncbi:MAG: molecular chaperone [Lachnospiraceae bacterium]|nr:molecular chaperone [Lachnospiraceae bacterium]